MMNVKRVVTNVLHHHVMTVNVVIQNVRNHVKKNVVNVRIVKIVTNAANVKNVIDVLTRTSVDLGLSYVVDASTVHSVSLLKMSAKNVKRIANHAANV